MGLRLGISELYVDVALTLVVLSVSGALIASYSSLIRPLSVAPGSFEEPPLALLVSYRDRKYLIVVNYVGDRRELVLMYGSSRIGTITLGAREVRVVEATTLPDDIYIVTGSYAVRPEVVVLR